jgi:peptidoglycan hydrolase CwlO-like protein
MRSNRKRASGRRERLSSRALHTFAVGKSQILVHNASASDLAEWQKKVDELKEKIAELQEKIDSIQNTVYGYGRHRASGSQSEFAQLMKQLADLIAARPK